MRLKALVLQLQTHIRHSITEKNFSLRYFTILANHLPVILKNLWWKRFSLLSRQFLQQKLVCTRFNSQDRELYSICLDICFSKFSRYYCITAKIAFVSLFSLLLDLSVIQRFSSRRLLEFLYESGYACQHSPIEVHA